MKEKKSTEKQNRKRNNSWKAIATEKQKLQHNHRLSIATNGGQCFEIMMNNVYVYISCVCYYYSMEGLGLYAVSVHLYAAL